MEEKTLQELVAEKLGKKDGLPMREDTGTTKYLVHAKIEATGVVERPDVVGAIFGQTEGLLGDELDLRELLKSGRIGRIKVDINSAQGKSNGTIVIPSSLDRVETAIIAAALETIDRVGPCEATIRVERIEDVRDAKRKIIIGRAKEILKLVGQEGPETQEISDQVKESVRVEEIMEYRGLPAGPGIMESDAIIIVEGRADVLNLLRSGIKNVIAVEGTSVPQAVAELSKNKTTTAFVDSDRGGDLILKELMQVAEIDYIARPPEKKSVEDLTRKEIIKALRNKVPVTQVVEHEKLETGESDIVERKDDFNKLENVANRLRGTLKASFLNNSFEEFEEAPVRDLKEKLLNTNGINAVVFDGIITQELSDLAAERGIKYLVGMHSRIERAPANIRIFTLNDLRQMKHRQFKNQSTYTP